MGLRTVVRTCSQPSGASGLEALGQLVRLEPLQLRVPDQQHAFGEALQRIPHGGEHVVVVGLELVDGSISTTPRRDGGGSWPFIPAKPSSLCTSMCGLPPRWLGQQPMVGRVQLEEAQAILRPQQLHCATRASGVVLERAARVEGPHELDVVRHRGRQVVARPQARDAFLVFGRSAARGGS